MSERDKLDPGAKILLDDYRELYAIRLELMHRTQRVAEHDLRRVLWVLDNLSDADVVKVARYAEALAEWPEPGIPSADGA